MANTPEQKAQVIGLEKSASGAPGKANGTRRVRLAIFPETDAGGYCRRDGTVEFFGRVNALLTSEMTVLDFGAGRGRAIQEDPVNWRRSLQTLKQRCKRLIGVDIDPVVLQNPALDEAKIIGKDGRIDVGDSSVDMIVSDATFEHVENPELTTSELGRVLKPGGWICARTPNKFGYIGIGTNVIPNKWHVALLRYLQPYRKAEDVFPTVYRLNTKRSLKKYFPESEWKHCVYGHFAEPAYFGESRLLWRLVLFSYRFTPNAMAPTWMIFLQKK